MGHPKKEQRGKMKCLSHPPMNRVCELFFYLLHRINLPPVSPHFGFISGDPLNGDRLSDLGYLARNLRYALRHDAVRPVHAHCFRAFTDANVRVAVLSLYHLSDEAAYSRVG